MILTLEEFADMIKGGLSDKITLEDIASKWSKKMNKTKDEMLSILKDQLEIGIQIEKEHTSDEALAREIAKDHLTEDPIYYTKLKKMENE